MQPAIPTTPRLATKRLGLALLLAGTLMTGMVFMSLLQRQKAVTQPGPPPLPPIYEVQGEVDAFQRLQLKTSYAGEDRTPPKPLQTVTPPTLPPPPPMFPAQVASTAPPLAALPPVIPPTPVIPAMTTAPAQSPPPVKMAPVEPLTPPEKKALAESTRKKEADDWLFADVKGARRQHQGESGTAAPKGEGPPPPSRRRESKLFPMAGWERPARPEQVIYSSQLMQCLLEQAIKTGQDGTIRCRTTETLYDKFGQLQTLVPMHSLIMGSVKGARVQPGQTSVPIDVTKVELPDGTDLPLTGKMGGANGMSGVEASRVDNRYPQIVGTALLTALLTIGTRSIAGSPEGFQPNLAQEFTADVGNSVARSGQELVKRTLSIDPVLWVDAQTPVTIQLDKNISLQSAPVIVHR